MGCVPPGEAFGGFPLTHTRSGGRGVCGNGTGPMAVGVACKTDAERTRRPPHPFPPNPALGLGRRGDRPRQRTAPPGCTGGDDAPIRGRPRSQPARACWCASGLSPWKVIKQKFGLDHGVGHPPVTSVRRKSTAAPAARGMQGFKFLAGVADTVIKANASNSIFA